MSVAKVIEHPSYNNFKAVNLGETSIVTMQNLFAQVSDIGPSWSSCCVVLFFLCFFFFFFQKKKNAKTENVHFPY